MIEGNKEVFERLARSYIKRDGIETILERLAKTDFYTAPASTRFHDSNEGGLCTHSLNVYTELFSHYAEELYDSMGELTNPSLLESVAIVSLFHDICKTNFYKIEMRNTKDEFGKWIKVPYYTVEDKFPFGHGEKSVLLLRECMELTDDELLAIRWHMGGFSSKEEQQSCGKAFAMSDLALELHLADLRATYKRRYNGSRG